MNDDDVMTADMDGGKENKDERVHASEHVNTPSEHREEEIVGRLPSTQHIESDTIALTRAGDSGVVFAEDEDTSSKVTSDPRNDAQTQHVDVISIVAHTEISLSDDGYKSPVLVEDSASFVDPYSIIQVRNAVEHLESDQDVDDHQRVFSHHSETQSTHSTSDDVSEQPSSSPTIGLLSDISNISNVAVENRPRSCSLFASAKSVRDDGEGIQSLSINVSAPTSAGSTLESSESDQHPREPDSDKCILFDSASSPQSQMCTSPKRGKKRAQDEVDIGPPGNSSVRVLLDFDDGNKDDDNETILTRHRVPKFAFRRPYYPSWLHESFHVAEEDMLLPRPSRQDLSLLHEAIAKSTVSWQVFKELFNSVFGVIWCEGRTLAMMDTVQAIKHAANASEVRPGREPHFSTAARHLIAQDLFTGRYLSCFPSFDAFQANLALLRSASSGKTFDEFVRRMSAWYGGTSRDGYDYWALARRLFLDAQGYAPMKPEDLTVEDRREWVSKLSQCDTIEEADKVTEEVFGPLTPVRGFSTPQVDLIRYWDNCVCGICTRAKKRTRLDYGAKTFSARADEE